MNLKAHAREIILASVLVVLVFLWFRPSAPPAPAADPAKPDEKKVDMNQIVSRIPDPEFGRLQGSGGDYQGGGRNLFDFGTIKPPPPPPPTPEELARAEREAAKRRQDEEKARQEAEKMRQEALELQRQEAEKARQAAAEEARRNPPPPPKPTPPACDLKLFGLVGERGQQIAILVDGNTFLMAKEGETVKQSFRVEKIGYDSLRLGYTDPRFKSEHLTLTLGTSS